MVKTPAKIPPIGPDGRCTGCGKKPSANGDCKCTRAAKRARKKHK